MTEWKAFIYIIYYDWDYNKGIKTEEKLWNQLSQTYSSCPQTQLLINLSELSLTFC